MGDSITELTNYPDDLQAMLGVGYIVGNFGVSGSTVLLDTYTPYMHQTAFIDAKNCLPDIVIIMLGTNDARTDNFQSIDNFVADYTMLINSIQSSKTKPQIFIVKPPPLFENELDLKSQNLLKGIIPRIEQTANALGLQVIDVYFALENHPEYFQDGVHPNNEGATVIAEQIYNAIISTET
ncbi:MAG: GDSL-type esterase/lipase family protein [Candidatus Bathyarchaeota archaeon]|nr:GDSL-type esterase/lipase family protein [Candidatus Bathyarchaeum sp.]